VLIHKTPDDAAATGEALKFFAWAYAKDGKETAKALDYVSIPDSVVDLIKDFLEGRHPGRRQARLRRRCNILDREGAPRRGAPFPSTQGAELHMSAVQEALPAIRGSRDATVRRFALTDAIFHGMTRASPPYWCWSCSAALRSRCLPDPGRRCRLLASPF
jgi:hypothetical protein